MQGIEATIGDVPLGPDRETGGVARVVILGALMGAAVGSVIAYALHPRPEPAPAIVRAAPQPAPAIVEDPAKLFGAVIVEPEWREALVRGAEPPIALPTLDPVSTAAATPAAPAETVASLPPSPEAAPPEAAAATPASPTIATPPALADVIPLPPVRDVPEVADDFPLPPMRPPELAALPPTPAEPERRIAPPEGAPPLAPVPSADNRSALQKLFGLGPSGGPTVASRPAVEPAQPARPAVAPAPQPPAPAAATTVAARAPAPNEGRGGLFGFLFGHSSSDAGLERFGYDRQTAIYVISRRTVYMPDGSRLEAHSGLGGMLDDVRYIGERARGPTPPHLYDLSLRESLFHGVQALRLNPVGDGSVYGRDGLLAHSFMLGPNGDSNGCVSFRNYEAFLRAYQNGQVRRLAVVTNL